ncbi:MAG: helix-turn-helix domain-containing protein, partial [Candidatus Tectimicrobiota bacterium]
MATELAPPEDLEPDETLGHFLKRERSLRGVSLQEVADATKISLRFLEALEADEYDVLPSRAFIIGFLRAYAQCLKIDPQEVVLLYEHGVTQTRAIPEAHRPE